MLKSSHSVTELAYHIVIVTKKRRPLLTGGVEELVMSECRRMIEHFEGEVLEMETDVDHIHILARLSHKYSISQVMNSLKGVSARIVRRDYGDVIQKQLKGTAFWSPSYYIATTGDVTIEKIRRYVESQSDVDHRKVRPKRSR